MKRKRWSARPRGHGAPTPICRAATLSNKNAWNPHAEGTFTRMQAETVVSISHRRAKRAETVMGIADRRAKRAETVVSICDWRVAIRGFFFLKKKSRRWWVFAIGGRSEGEGRLSTTGESSRLASNDCEEPLSRLLQHTRCVVFPEILFCVDPQSCLSAKRMKLL